MKKALLISLSLVLALVWQTAVKADDGFYVVAGQKAKYAPVPKTGQTSLYATGDDGDLKKGVTWPDPRFTDNGNGTVTDNLTGLIWLKDAYSEIPNTWPNALSIAATVSNGNHGLSDGSQPGDWRLPNVRELQSLVDYGHANPALPSPYPFQNVIYENYWSSTTSAGNTAQAWNVSFINGAISTLNKIEYHRLWFVRGGK
jgi:Protein of unknown function (DUF1566)